MDSVDIDQGDFTDDAILSQHGDYNQLQIIDDRFMERINEDLRIHHKRSIERKTSLSSDSYVKLRNKEYCSTPDKPSIRRIPVAANLPRTSATWKRLSYDIPFRRIGSLRKMREENGSDAVRDGKSLRNSIVTPNYNDMIGISNSQKMSRWNSPIKTPVNSRINDVFRSCHKASIERTPVAANLPRTSKTWRRLSYDRSLRMTGFFEKLKTNATANGSCSHNNEVDSQYLDMDESLIADETEHKLGQQPILAYRKKILNGDAEICFKFLVEITD